MIGERIKQGRLVEGLTLDQAVERLAECGVSISKQGLSNYERDKRTPKASVLMALAKALHVKADYFLSEPEFTIKWTAFRCQARLLKRRKEEIKATAQSVVERQMYLQSTLFPGSQPAFPPKVKARSEEDAENAAEKLRDNWNLGVDAIESLTQTVESKGAIVVEYPMRNVKFDGLSGWVNKTFPVLVVNSAVPTDRIRFNLAHELGHIVMDCGGASDKRESLAHRFAGAFLAPADAVKMELGERRRTISPQELALLKKRYGLSMQGFIHRAGQLDIVSQAECIRMWKTFSRLGWRKKEPVECAGDERPTRLTQLAMRAFAEGIITEERAQEIAPDIEFGGLSGLPVEGVKSRSVPTARDLLQMPPKERLLVLAEATAGAQVMYEEDPELSEWAELGVEDMGAPR